MFQPCAVIPIYDHAATVGAVVNSALAYELPCILVDDGSSPQCAKVLDGLAAAQDRVKLLRHPRNRGKGAAVMTAIRFARQSGFTHALQIDADGQHLSADIPRFIERASANPDAVIVGCPEFDGSVPAIRFIGRYLTHLWVVINTLSLAINDSMCGFRVYPVEAVIDVDRHRRLGSRMSFDTEVLVRLYWEGWRIINLPTPVRYPEKGISHFRGFLDNLLLSRTHATLFFGMLARLPILLTRRRNAS
jgi:glycosyltransferase involved in cell wall biosynthesis